jgi:hypothetical protein
MFITWRPSSLDGPLLSPLLGPCFGSFSLLPDRLDGNLPGEFPILGDHMKKGILEEFKNN